MIASPAMIIEEISEQIHEHFENIWVIVYVISACDIKR